MDKKISVKYILIAGLLILTIYAVSNNFFKEEKIMEDKEAVVTEKMEVKEEVVEKDTSFSGVFNRNEVNLSSEDLTELPKGLINNSSMEILNLSYNQIETLPSQIQNWKSLKILDLEYNKMRSLPAEIGKLKNLEELDISGNGMTDLPAEVGQLSNLKVLRMSNNSFTGLPNELGNLKQLEVLDISGNNLDENAMNMINTEFPNTQIRK